MRFIELFAGIGGFRLGLEKAFCNKNWGTKSKKKWEYKQNNVYTKSKHQAICVYANEWDKYACQIYRKNFGDKEIHEGDIREVSAESIPDHDFLTGGFPCPTYSIAGKRKGFDDPRGLVFFNICRIAKVKKPRLLLLENVKGLLNHDGGKTFRIILNSLSELGYDCEWEVLNSKNFGVPQNRERVFIVGHLRGKGGQKIFPLGETDKTYSKCDGRESEISSTRQNIQPRNRQAKSTSGDTWINFTPNEDLARPLDANYAKGWLDHEQRTMILRDGRDNRSCLRSGRIPELGIKGLSIRRLTPTECERLQGFPDGWTEGLSNTQRYKCLGNAVTVNVIEEIGKRIARVQQRIF